MLENAFELDLPKLMRTAKASGSSRLVLDDDATRTVVMLAPTRLAVFLGGRTWIADIVPVKCLHDRVRPLLKCPRAHEGNFQSLYFWAGELACRRCHRLRYRSTLAPSSASRVRLGLSKLMASMGADPGQPLPQRQPFKWRKRHLRRSKRAAQLSGIHYNDLRLWLERLAVSS